MRLALWLWLGWLAFAPPSGAYAQGGGEGEPAVVCAPDASGARLAVELAFAELQRLHRGRVPGPSGQALMTQRLDRLLARFVVFNRFVDLALGDAWEAAPERRNHWQGTIEDFLKRRYLDRLGSPLGVRLDFSEQRLDCDEARVTFTVSGPGGRKRTEVVLRLALDLKRNEEGAPEEVQPDFGPSRWRAFDVSVDGASLLETWRGRFRRIYADGGVAAIEEHLRNLSSRHPSRGEEP